MKFLVSSELVTFHVYIYRSSTIGHIVKTLPDIKAVWYAPCWYSNTSNADKLQTMPRYFIHVFFLVQSVVVPLITNHPLFLIQCILQPRDFAHSSSSDSGAVPPFGV
jgi:hypothetical protein